MPQENFSSLRAHYVRNGIFCLACKDITLYMEIKEWISISLDKQEALNNFMSITVAKANDTEPYDNSHVPGNGFCIYGIQETNGGIYAYKL